jgi:hypothetical protein
MHIPIFKILWVLGSLGLGVATTAVAEAEGAQLTPWAAILTTAVVTGTLAAIPPMVVAFMARNKVQEVQGKVQEVHLLINSRFDEWRPETKKSAFAEGVKSETDRQAGKDASYAEGAKSESDKQAGKDEAAAEGARVEHDKPNS